MKVNNGLYLTHSDFVQFQDKFESLINSMDLLTGKKIKSGIRCKSITFVVTEKCNLNCSYCYETHKSNKSMSKEIAKQSIDFIFNDKLTNGYLETDNCESVILDFIGGEPLLEIDLMDYIVDYFKLKAFEVNSPWAINYMINITSNGILYNTPKVQEFIKKNFGKVSIGITIDGNKKLHDSCRVFPNGEGSYDIVEKSIQTWLKYQPDAQTKITLCPDNVMYLNDAIRNVWSLGIHGCFTNCVYEEGWTPEHANILYNEMIKLADYILDNDLYKDYMCSLFDDTIGQNLPQKDNWCGGNGKMLAIGTDGRCFPCIRFMKYSLNNAPEQPIGDIFNGINVGNPWLIKLKKVDMISQCQHEDTKKCLTCKVASGCSLCTGFNYDEFGDPNHRATYICITHKARVLANTYYWNKLYKKLNINNYFNCNLEKHHALEIISENEYDYLLSL